MSVHGWTVVDTPPVSCGFKDDRGVGKKEEEAVFASFGAITHCTEGCLPEAPSTNTMRFWPCGTTVLTDPGCTNRGPGRAGLMDRGI